MEPWWKYGSTTGLMSLEERVRVKQERIDLGRAGRASTYGSGPVPGGMTQSQNQMTHYPFVDPYEGVTENFALGVREGPGEAAGLFDIISDYTLPGMLADYAAPSSTTLKGEVDQMMDLDATRQAFEQLGPYGAPEELQTLSQFAGSINSDPFMLGGFAMDAGYMAGKGAAKTLNYLAKDNPVFERVILENLPVRKDVIEGGKGLTPIEGKILEPKKGYFDDPAVQTSIRTKPDGSEKMLMTHYGNKHEVLDPSYAGTGLDSKTISARNQASDPDRVPRTYFGADVADPKLRYKVEQGIPGGIPHKVEVEVGVRGGLYDTLADPDNLIPEPEAPANAAEGILPGTMYRQSPQELQTQAEKRVHEAGYGGMLYYSDQLGYVPIMFDKMRVPLSASDVPRVNFPDDATAPGLLTRKSVGKNPYKVGAPVQITGRRQEKKWLEDYLQGVVDGGEGRGWYDEVSGIFDQDVGNISGQRRGAKDVQAGVFAEYSPRTTIKANELARIRSNNQAAVGEDVAAATAPRNEAAQRLLETSTLSEKDRLKVGPFAMSSAGLKPPRATNDFRQALALGFDKAETEHLGMAQHRWMDGMMDEAVALANERKLLGFDDWTHEKLQAARWVMHKASDPKRPRTVEQIMQEMDEAREGMTAKVFSEQIPSKELVGELDDASKGLLTRERSALMQNVDDQNVIVHQQGLLGGKEQFARGNYEDITNPNVITDIMADPAKGGSGMISSWSEIGVKFHGALRGLMQGQADVAWSFLRKAGKAGDINAARLPFNRVATEADRQSYKVGITKAMEDRKLEGFLVINKRDKNNLEATWVNGENATAKEISASRKGFREVVKEKSNGRAVEGVNSGNLITFADEYKPSAWMKELQNPKMRDAVEAMLPRIAKDMEEGLKKLPLTDQGRKVYQKTLQLIQSGGLKAVEAAVKAKVLPAAILGAFLSAEMATREEPAAKQGLL
jgi:hypothetical protein